MEKERTLTLLSVKINLSKTNICTTMILKFLFWNSYNKNLKFCFKFPLIEFHLFFNLLANFYWNVSLVYTQFNFIITKIKNFKLIYLSCETIYFALQLFCNFLLHNYFWLKTFLSFYLNSNNLTIASSFKWFQFFPFYYFLSKFNIQFYF